MSQRSRVISGRNSLLPQLAGAGELHHTTLRQYTDAIKSLSERRSTAERAILLFPQIRLQGLCPDAYTFTYALKATAAVSAVATGRQIHGQAVKAGLDFNLYTGTALVQMYASGGRIGSAGKVFDQMPVRNVFSWTTLISAYVKAKQPEEAIEAFRRMRYDAVEPDPATLTTVLSACADIGVFDLGEWIHSYIIEHRLRTTASLINALIDMYAKSGQISKAMKVFEDFRSERNVITWTTMICGLSAHGFPKEAIEIFKEMEQAGEKPNEVTFLALLSACGHGGLVDLGRHYFRKMLSTYKINPGIKHYASMVSLLSRAGLLQEAEALATSMPFEANAAVWGPILAAARNSGDAEIGSRAAGELFRLEPANSGNYLLLSNTYAALGRWDEAAMARRWLRDSRAKARGSCWIEVDGVRHEFAASDGRHPQVEEVYGILQQVYRELKVDENGGLEIFEEGGWS